MLDRLHPLLALTGVLGWAITMAPALLGGPALAGAEVGRRRPLTTDRPDRTESPYPVEPGRVQAEMDVVSHTRDANDDARSETLRLAVANMKLGVTRRADLQLVVEPWVHEHVRPRAGDLDAPE